jgi:hypothetical protein
MFPPTPAVSSKATVSAAVRVTVAGPVVVVVRGISSVGAVTPEWGAR